MGRKPIEKDYNKKPVDIEKQGQANKTARNQLDSAEKYNKQFDKILLRMPSGWNEKLKAYVKRTDNEYTSVNQFLCELIRREVKDIDE